MVGPRVAAQIGFTVTGLTVRQGRARENSFLLRNGNKLTAWEGEAPAEPGGNAPAKPGGNAPAEPGGNAARQEPRPPQNLFRLRF
jgi:hypothetical protein